MMLLLQGEEDGQGGGREVESKVEGSRVEGEVEGYDVVEQSSRQ